MVIRKLPATSAPSARQHHTRPQQDQQQQNQQHHQPGPIATQAKQLQPQSQQLEQQQRQLQQQEQDRHQQQRHRQPHAATHSAHLPLSPATTTGSDTDTGTGPHNRTSYPPSSPSGGSNPGSRHASRPGTPAKKPSTTWTPLEELVKMIPSGLNSAPPGPPTAPGEPIRWMKFK